MRMQFTEDQISISLFNKFCAAEKKAANILQEKVPNATEHSDIGMTIGMTADYWIQASSGESLHEVMLHKVMDSLVRSMAHANSLGKNMFLFKYGQDIVVFFGNSEKDLQDHLSKLMADMLAELGSRLVFGK